MFKTFFVFIKIINFVLKNTKLLIKVKKLKKQGKDAEADALIQPKVNEFAAYCTKITGSTVEVSGLENIPKDKPVVYIANHQGLMDMPLMLGYIPYPKGFIAKIETLKIPGVSTWMKLMNCVFMDRKNFHQAVNAIYDGVEKVKQGHSMVIFPEGTRSRGREVKQFKPGSFKLAFNSEADIVPVSIDGTWHVYEETGKIKGAPMRLTIHPPVKTAGLTKEQQQEVVKQIQQTITSSLTQLSFAKPISTETEKETE